MSSELTAFADRFLAAWNSRDVEQVAVLYAAEYEGNDVAEAAPQRGPAAVCLSATRYLHAFPDLTLVRESVVAEGNQVAMAWRAHGTHRGRLLNIPPSGQRVAVRGVSFLKVEAGQIVRGLHIWDMAGMLRQIGLLTELPS